MTIRRIWSSRASWNSWTSWTALGWFALCACVPVAVQAGGFERDWHAYPAVVQVDTTQTVYAVGDAHGDPDRLAAALAKAGIIAAVPASFDQVQWAAGKSVLVVTGDMIDKWHNSLGVITLLRTLSAGATQAGGRVVVTMGNHEAEFLAEPSGKKTAEFQNELTAAKLDPVQVAACKGEVGTFLCNLPAAARVNDWFFSHAGNSGGRSIAQLEADIRSGLKQDGWGTAQLVGENSILEARLNKKGPNGMAWFMDGDKKTDAKKLLKRYAKALGVNHLAQGHQYGNVKFPDKGDREEFTFFQRYGLLFLLDSGMSRGIEDSDSAGGVVKIADGKAQVLCANGKTETLWSSKHQQDLKSQHCGVPK